MFCAGEALGVEYLLRQQEEATEDDAAGSDGAETQPQVSRATTSRVPEGCP